MEQEVEVFFEFNIDVVVKNVCEFNVEIQMGRVVF